MTENQNDKPNCFGKLYDETDCVECVFKDDCKVGIKPEPVVQVTDDEDLEAAAAAALEAENGVIELTDIDPEDEENKKTETEVIDTDTVETKTVEDEVIELAKVVEAEITTDKEPVKKEVETAKKPAPVKAKVDAEPTPDKEINKGEKKAAPEAEKPAKKKPVKKKKVVEVPNRQPFKTLMGSGKITPLVDDVKKKTYLQVEDDGIHVYKSQIYHEKNLAEFADSGANPFKDGSIPAEVFDYLKKGNEVTFRDAFNHLKTAFPGKNDATLMNRAADVLSGAHFFGIAKVTRKVGRQKFFQMQ